MHFPIYDIWTDKMFYVYAAAGAGAVVFLIYSIRRWLELANAAPYGEEPEPRPHLLQADEPAETMMEPETAEAPDIEALVREGEREAEVALARAEAPAEEPAQPEPEPAAEQAGPRREERPAAEDFVKELYGNMARFDTRLGSIERTLAERSGSRSFMIMYLEDVLKEYDSLNPEKVKAKIEYLLADLNGTAGEPGDKKE